MPNKEASSYYVLIALGIFLVGGFFLSLRTGPISFSVMDTLIDKWRGIQTSQTIALWEIRLPRAILAACVGGTLGLSGAAMQGLLRNPLAEPGILGVTGGAVLGAG